MREALEKELKQEMGYSEDVCPSCNNCGHSLEKENLHVDRDWYWVCNFNSIGAFTVKANGRCKHFIVSNQKVIK